MSVLITGGAGFIGSHMAERLLCEGNDVVVIDDLSTGRVENIAHLRKFKGFEFFDESIFNYSLVEDIVKRCETIYHLAAAVGVQYIVDNQVRSIAVNVRGTEIILELAARYDRKIFIASSSEVYGKNQRRVLNEDDDSELGNTRIPRWSYGHSKAVDEFLAIAYHREKDLRVVIGRYFNTCGPRQVGRYGMVIPRFISQALKNEPITVYGDGKQVRAFNYVTDTIDATLMLMEHPDAIGDVFNIGNPEGVTILNLAERIKESTGSSSDIILVPYKDAFKDGFEDMMYRVPDLSKIEHTAGYKPKYNLEQMLETTIEHIRNEGKAE